MGNRSSQDELTTRNTTNTPTFLETCALDVDHKALEEHLVNNQVLRNDLDRSLLRGLQVVQRKERELSQVAQALTILLQSGANWDSEVLLEEHKTPYHIICESPGDQHELLDLIIKSSQQTIIDTEDIDECSALIYAVRNENVNCAKCLINNGADINIRYDTYTSKNKFLIEEEYLNPIMEAIRILSFRTGHLSSVVMSNIFDLLFDAAVEKNKRHFRNCRAYIICAVIFENVHSVKRLISVGAPLNIIGYADFYVWESVARMGNVELLKCMFNIGIDKDSTPQNRSIMWHIVLSENIEAVRYLLDIGVTIPTYAPKVQKAQCERCKKNILIMKYDNGLGDHDPCLTAICHDMLEIVKLLDEYGGQRCKSFAALRCALNFRSEAVLSYLLNKYTYPLNIEYCIYDNCENVYTVLTDPSTIFAVRITKLLLDHGADPAKQMCSPTSANAIMAATNDYRHLEVIAQYIRSGVDINFRSWAYEYENVSPFELSVLRNHHYISLMFLTSGCSHGVFTIRKLKAESKHELEKLMKAWNVYDDNVTPLKQRCRCVILNQLSPRADMKIKKLPLPRCVIKFLNIPELDDVVYEYNRMIDSD